MKSFWFILSPLNVKGRLPFEIIPGHWFDKATSRQVAFIKKGLESFVAPSEIPAYEHDWVEHPESTPDGEMWSGVRLPRKKWRYWVVNAEEGDRETTAFGIAAALLQKEIELAFTVTFRAAMRTLDWQSGRARFFENAEVKTVRTVTTSILKQITRIYEKLKAAEADYQHVYQAACRYHSLRFLPQESEMLVVGYFAIIEALIAHKPRLQESLDSINHQLQSKMILLSKRFQRQLDYSSYFGQMREEKVWKQLYAYRSAIAHDTLVDVQSKFQSLKGQANVLGFLREVVKLLLLFGLNEPVLLADLKNC